MLEGRPLKLPLSNSLYGQPRSTSGRCAGISGWAARRRARSSDAATRAATEALVAAAADWRVTFRADAVRLYRSRLGHGPARYEVVAEVALAG